MTAAVIIATYNGEKYIKEQIESILNQTRKVDKIFIFDDRSTDKTFEICNAIKKEHNDLIEVHKNETNLGYRKNFEQALLAVKNYDIIFFCDQDDWWFPNKVETIVPTFEKSKKLTLFFSNAYITDENLNIDENKVLFDFFFNDIKHKYFLKNPNAILCSGRTVTGCTMAIRNTIVDKVIPFSEIWIHDEWIAAIASFFGTVKYSEEKLVKYRQHTSQSIGTRNASNKNIETTSNNNDIAHNNGFDKIKYARTQDAVNFRLKELDRKIENLSESIEKNIELNKRIPIQKINTKKQPFIYEWNAINILKVHKAASFFNALKENYHKNFFSRFWFFIVNNINGNYKNADMPFIDSVRDIFMHKEN